MIKDVKEKADNSLTTMDATLEPGRGEYQPVKTSRRIAEKDRSGSPKQTVDMIHQIATASEEQAQVSEDVLKNMEKVSGYAADAKRPCKDDFLIRRFRRVLAHSLYSQLCSVKKDAMDDAMEESLRSFSAKRCLRSWKASLQQGRLEAAALFDEQYVGTDEPDKYTTRANRYFEAEVLPLLKNWARSDKRITYVVVMDKNGYMPTHTNPARAKVRMQDPISLAGARSDTDHGAGIPPSHCGRRRAGRGYCRSPYHRAAASGDVCVSVICRIWYNRKIVNRTYFGKNTDSGSVCRVRGILDTISHACAGLVAGGAQVPARDARGSPFAA